MTQTQRGLLGGLLSLALAPILATCGSNGLESCGKVQPCGGDVVGNWTIAGECFNTASINTDIMAECPGATVNTSGIRVSGNVAFNADMTYSMTETVSATISETIPASCLTMNGVTVTCAQVDQILQMEIQMNPGTFASARCTGGASCTCSFTLAPQTMSESGSYTTSGTSISLNGSSSPYCVQGNEMHLLSLNTTMPMGSMGQANIDADVVLKK